MRTSSVALLVIGLTTIAAQLNFAAGVSLTLIPANGAVMGAAGSTVGWGYSISNSTSDWLQTLNVSADLFQEGTPNVLFDFPAVAPNSSVTLDFSLAATGSCASPPCGLYDLTWDTTAPPNFNNSGTFTISSDFYSAQPGTLGAVDLGPAPDATASYSATVARIATPEASTLSLFLTGLVAQALLFCFKHKRASSTSN